jgi:carbon monoxide dehydrogenase subunit G
MKKIIVTLLLGIVFVNGIFAQMATAQTIVWDLEVEAQVDASHATVWKYLNDAKMVEETSNGFVKSMIKTDEKVPVSVNVHFSNGNKRSETIVQINHVYKFMSIDINKESLPKGVKNGEFSIFTKSDDDGRTSISWKAKIDGNKNGKQKLIRQLKTEFEAYKIGFGKIAGTVEN